MRKKHYSIWFGVLGLINFILGVCMLYFVASDKGLRTGIIEIVLLLYNTFEMIGCTILIINYIDKRFDEVKA